MSRCNHCGRELDSLIDYEGAEIIIDRATIKCDLCFDCRNELVKLNKKFVKQQGAK